MARTRIAAAMAAVLVAVGGMVYVVGHPPHASGRAAELPARQGETSDLPLTVAETVLVGRVRLAGGPAPGGTLPAGPGRVRIIGSGVDTTGQVDRNGDWRIPVPPGRYTVLPRIPGLTCAPQTVEVAAAATRPVASYCPIK